MKHWAKLAVVIAVVALLLGIVAITYADQAAAPIAQAGTATPAAAATTAATAAPAATPAATAPATNQDPENPVVPFVEAWQGSPHADAEAEAFVHWDEEGPMPANCAKCHSTEGYLDFLQGEEPHAYQTGSIISCVACHNAETMAKTTVTFPSGMEIVDLGDESRCMECHQGRESKMSVDKQIEDFEATDPDVVPDPIEQNGREVAFGFRNIHYFAAAATQYGTLAKGGYEYEGQVYDGKFAHPAPFDTCNGCHDPHALELNLEACATCHEGVEAVEDLNDIRMAGSLMDYDGDGDAEEGVQAEYLGLRELLFSGIQAYAEGVVEAPVAYSTTVYPYFIQDENANGTVDTAETKAYASWTPRLLKAAYNYQLSGKDPGAFAHNAKYVIQLMHDSIGDLNESLAEPIDIEAAARNDAGHFDGSSEAFRHWDEEGQVPPGCAKCHSSAGLPQFIQSGGTVAVDGRGTVHTVGTSAAPLSNGLECGTCHNDLAEYSLFPVTAVPMPSGRTVSFSEQDDEGEYGDPQPSNLCLECHQGRASTTSVNNRTRGMEDDETPEAGLSFINVHYFAAGASIFGDEAQGAYQYPDKEYAGRFMHVPGFDTCAGCHNPHALEVKMDACVGCHAGVEEPSEIRLVKEDLDGDEDVEEGAAGEILTLQEKLLEAITLYAQEVAEAPIVYDPAAYPYFFGDENANGKVDEGETGYSGFTPRLLKAAYNYQYAQKDPGIYAHNLDYATQFLYDSIEDLGNGGIEVDLTGLVRPEVAAEE